MFAYDFMLNAFAAASVVAVVAALVGTFLVLRGQTFAGHALAHVGFTGATGALLIGLPPLWGLVLLTVLAGILMGALGEKMAGRDVAIGLVLAVSLALGLLFLHFFTAFASQATALLFGNVLSLAGGTVWTLAGLGALTLGGLACIARPLLFATLQPELAEARGVDLRLIGTLFLAIVALATAIAAQIVGVLLVFALMVGPPATALRLTTRLDAALALAVGLALAEAWGGLACAWWTDWPVSFWITALAAGAYLLAAALPQRAGPVPAPGASGVTEEVPIQPSFGVRGSGLAMHSRTIGAQNASEAKVASVSPE